MYTARKLSAKKQNIFLFGLFGYLLLCYSKGHTGIDTAQLGAQNFSLVATQIDIPGLKSQTTDRGKVINSLYPYQNRIYFGYGDYGSNTGPILVSCYKVASDQFEASYAAQTEEVFKFCELNGDLYFPNVDPRSPDELGSVFRYNASQSQWEKKTPIPNAYHVLDVTGFQGNLYCAPGAGTVGATYSIMKSTDQGQTWSNAGLSVTPASSGNFIRFYYLGATSKSLFVSGYEFGADQPFSHIFVDGVWTQLKGTPGTGTLAPMVANDRMTIAHFQSGHPMAHAAMFLGAYVLEDDSLVKKELLPTGLRLVNWSVQKAAPGLDEEWIWALFSNNANEYEIHASADFANWKKILTLLQQEPFCSITYLNNNLYLGTKEGDFYMVEQVFALTGDDVQAPTVIIKTPVVGDTIPAGGLVEVQWSSLDDVGVDSIAVHAALPGVGWTHVYSAQTGFGSWPWPVPAQSSATCSIRVDAYDPSGNLGSALVGPLFIVASPSFTCPDSVIAFANEKVGFRITYDLGAMTGKVGLTYLQRPAWVNTGPADTLYGIPAVVGTDTVKVQLDVNGMVCDTLVLRIYIVPRSQVVLGSREPSDFSDFNFIPWEKPFRLKANPGYARLLVYDIKGRLVWSTQSRKAANNLASSGVYLVLGKAAQPSPVKIKKKFVAVH